MQQRVRTNDDVFVERMKTTRCTYDGTTNGFVERMKYIEGYELYACAAPWSM